MKEFESKQTQNLENETHTSQIVGIFTAPTMGVPMIGQERANVIAGRGIEGDRYESRTGAYSIRPGKTGRIPDEDRQISIIATQGLAEANARLIMNGIQPFKPEDTRRNLVIDINHEILNSLAGQRFRIGGIEFEGTELCDPCTRPAILMKRNGEAKAFEKAFEERGGLRARIINDGELQLGDELVVLETPVIVGE